MPKVSIILTLYNVKTTYIRECIESILAQTFQDFEILIINDGSERRFNYAQIYRLSPKIVWANNSRNRGMHYSVNRLFGIAQGEYIVRLGSDDMFDTKLLAKEVAILDAHPDVVACCCELDKFGTHTGVVHREPEFTLDTNIRSKCAVYGYGGGMMFRRSALETCHLDPKLKMCEDFDFHLQLLKLGRIVGIQEPLYKYRRHDASICRQTSKLERAAYMEYIFAKHHVDENLVSILMPTYNTDPAYVAECLRSINNSTYQNYEIVFVNDGSSYDYRELPEFKQLKDRIIYHVNSTNLGISTSLNLASSLAHGNYLLRIDSDDLVTPEFIQTEYEFLRDHEDYVAACCDLQLFGIRNTIIPRPKEMSLDNITDLKSARGYGYGCGVMYKRSVLAYCRYDPTYSVCEDFDFHLQLLAKGKMKTFPAMYRYRQHTASTIKQFNREQRVNLISAILIKHGLGPVRE